MKEPITSDQKKAFLLLQSVIFCFHGFDDEEKKIVAETAEKLKAHEEIKWVNEFLSEDFYNAFDRAREFFKNTISTYDRETRLDYLNAVWEATNLKGFISEMEATAMLKLARDWNVQKDLLELVRKV